VRQTAPTTGVFRQHHPDYQIVLYMGLLMLLGLITMYAIGPQRANVLNSAYGTDFYTSTYFFIKQSASLLLALVAFAVAATVPYEVIKKYAPILLMAGFGASLLLALLGNVLDVESITQCTLGACRWFKIPGLGTFQPAELLKFGILIFGAAFLGSRVARGTVNDFEQTIVPFSAVMGFAALLVVIVQNDLGTGLSLATIAASMLMVGGLNARMGGMLLAALVLLIGLFIIIAPHRIERMMTFLGADDSASSEGSGYHIKNAKIAIGTGGLFGVGIGNSVQATGYLPEAINDSVFAIMGETFGFVGLVVILFLFAALLLRLLRMVDHLADPWMRLVVAGVFGWLGAHVFLNVAAMIGVAPLTGITLPLLSFGGTSMMFVAGALGLTFQLSKYTSHSRINEKEARNEGSSSRRRVGRTRDAGRRSYTRA
jgi:cell division protein FtsW